MNSNRVGMLLKSDFLTLSWSLEEKETRFGERHRTTLDFGYKSLICCTSYPIQPLFIKIIDFTQSKTPFVCFGKSFPGLENIFQQMVLGSMGSDQ